MPMRRFAVSFRNEYGTTLAVVTMGLPLSELGNLATHVRLLGDKAFPGQWREARVQGLNVVVTNPT